MEVDRQFIKEKLESGVICIPFIPTTQEVTDVFTKGLLKQGSEFFVSKLGMINIYVPT